MKDSQSNLKKLIIASISFSLIIMILIFGLYYYFSILRKKDKFPQNNFQVDNDFYEKNNFKKVEFENQEYSYFIPNYWVLTDESLKAYSDILNGSNVYLHSFPNNLGILTTELCNNYSDQIKKEFTLSPIYNSANLVSKQIANLSGFEGCQMIFESKINNSNYEIRQFYIFLKDKIYQLFIQIPKDLPSQIELADLIEKSISIKY